MAEPPVPGSSAAAPVCPTPKGFAELNRQARALQTLLDQAQQVADPKARVLVERCLQSILALYGEGLARLIEIVQENPGPHALLQRFAQDSTVSGLLLIHGLHPIDLATRLQEALQKVRPYLESHGGNVELLSLADGYAKLRLRGACKTCPSSSITLELAVRKALEEACPDLLGFSVE